MGLPNSRRVARVDSEVEITRLNLFRGRANLLFNRWLLRKSTHTRPNGSFGVHRWDPRCKIASVALGSVVEVSATLDNYLN